MGDDLQMIQPSSNLPVRVILALSEQLTTKLTEKKAHKGEIRVSAGAIMRYHFSFTTRK